MRLIKKVLIVLAGLFLMSVFESKAQVDKTFWFVAPEVTSSHGDNPVYLRITTFDQPANVTISIPANAAFTPVNLVINANTQHRYEFTNLNLIENRPAATINNKGILITSNADVSVYYEVAHRNNPDKFTLKGENALGFEFYVPSQNHFRNRNLTVPDRERIDIVATEDNTVVTIDMSNIDQIEGHPANAIFEIVLNRGQTYCLQAAGTNAWQTQQHLGGAYIRSNKPIAVTISDDSVAEVSSGQTIIGAYDLIGDQLIPINIIGTDYIAMHTAFLQKEPNGTNITNSIQKVYILATQDNTEVYINGVFSKTLSRREMYSVNIANPVTGLVVNAIHITSNKPIYAYQVSGITHPNNPSSGNELGSAILPPIKCTGSSVVAVTRTLTQRFFMQIMTQYKNINNFQMVDYQGANANAFLPAASDWYPVTGTGAPGAPDTWYTAVKQMNLATGNPYRVINNGLFHLSVMDENSGSMSYGYFSSYSNLTISPPEAACVGDVVVLRTTQNLANLNWYYFNEQTFEEVHLGSAPQIIANETGRYIVRMVTLGCEASDELYVEFKRPEFTLGEDVEVCEGETVSFNISGFDGHIFNWQPITNNTNSYSFVPEAGQQYNLSLTITDPDGCSNTSTVNVSAYAIPNITLDISGNDICLGETVSLTGIQDGYSYQWSLNRAILPGETNPAITPTVSGQYSVVVTSPEACSNTHIQQINVNPLPTVTLSDEFKCQGESHTFSLAGYTSYLWHNGSTSNQITLTNPEPNVWVRVTNGYGCEASDTAAFEWHNSTVFSFGADTTMCAGLDMEIRIDNQFTNYEWRFNNPAGPVIPTTGSPRANNEVLFFETADHSLSGTYYISALDQFGCNINGSFNLSILPPPELQLEYDQKETGLLCRGDTIHIKIISDNSRDFIAYFWYRDGVLIPDKSTTEDFLEVQEPGIYSLTAMQGNGCYAQGISIPVALIDNPFFELEDVMACPGEDLVLKITNFRPGRLEESETPVTFPLNFDIDYYQWSHDVNHNQNTLSTQNQGQYTLTVFDKNGCFYTETARAQYFEKPEVILADQATCDNEPLALSLPIGLAAQINSYQWSFNGAPVADPNTVIQNGTYTLTIRDNNPITYANGDQGCESSATMELTLKPSPVFTLGDDRALCDGSTLSINADPSFSRYEWNGNNADGQTNSIVVNTADIFSLQVWNDEGCSNTDDVTIAVNSLPSIDLGSDIEVCPGETTVLSTPPFQNIFWSTGQRDVTSIEVGSGNFAVRVVDSNGCETKDEINILLKNAPQVDLGPDLVICPTNYPFTISLPTGDYVAWQWHTGSTASSITATLMDTVNIIRVMNADNCWSWAAMTLKFFPNPEYNLGDDRSVCYPEDITIDGLEFLTIAYSDDERVFEIGDWNWSNGETNRFVNITESGEYWVEVRDREGCFVLRDTINVTIHPTPVIAALDSTVYAQIVVFADGGTQPYYYSLNDGNSQTSNVFKKVPNGNHIIWVEDINGCIASEQFLLNSQYDLDIPNFFTPNGDGYNDTWKIDGLEKLPESVISIYDRYGKLLIKYTYLSKEEGWNGEYMGRPVPSDDYWYVIELIPVNKILRGNVTIKR